MAETSRDKFCVFISLIICFAFYIYTYVNIYIYIYIFIYYMIFILFIVPPRQMPRFTNIFFSVKKSILNKHKNKSNDTLLEVVSNNMLKILDTGK